jgi:hypothetical protein
VGLMVAPRGATSEKRRPWSRVRARGCSVVLVPTGRSKR